MLRLSLRNALDHKVRFLLTTLAVVMGVGFVVGSFVAAAILIVAFVAVEARGGRPMVPLRLFRNPTFTGAQLAAVGLSASLFALWFYLTLYLQQVLGLSAIAAGLVLVPGTLVNLLVASAMASLGQRVAPGRVIAGGSVVLFLLTLARMGGLASEVASQTERKRAMQTVLRATEQERVRLAADLHDGPVQELTALRYGLTRARNRIQRGQPDQAEGLLAELEDELAAGITGLRRLMAELRPAVLDEQGLEIALHNQIRAFEATSGVACAISTGLKGRLAPDLETVLYRVTQETLNNVGKHAGASRVTVSLAAENGSVRLRIIDDGIGFDPAQASRLLNDGHFGLAGMRERVELGGGRLDLDSQPGHGTTIHVALPARYASSVV